MSKLRDREEPIRGRTKVIERFPIEGCPCSTVCLGTFDGGLQFVGLQVLSKTPGALLFILATREQGVLKSPRILELYRSGKPGRMQPRQAAGLWDPRASGPGPLAAVKEAKGSGRRSLCAERVRPRPLRAASGSARRAAGPICRCTSSSVLQWGCRGQGLLLLLLAALCLQLMVCEVRLELGLQDNFV